MDIFGERIVRNEEKKLEYEDRIKWIKELSEPIIFSKRRYHEILA